MKNVLTLLKSAMRPDREPAAAGSESEMETRLAQRLRELTRERGSSLIETSALLPVLLLLLIGAVDYGRGYYTSIEVTAASESGALYGATNPLDVAGITSMAQMDAKDVSNLNVSSTYGCECADGSGASISCLTVPGCSSSNLVRYVDVSTSAVYTPILPYPLLPSSFTLSGKTRMRMASN